MTKDQDSVKAHILRYVFVDTCVIQDAGSKNKHKSDSVIKFLELIAKEGFRLAISEFTLYENLQGLWGKKATEATKILGNYESKQVSRSVLIVASMLQGLYHDEKIENISDGDKIIGSTALLENGFVLTRNHKDFPHPFFLTVKSFPVSFKTGQHTETLDFALYKPQLELIGRRAKKKDDT